MARVLSVPCRRARSFSGARTSHRWSEEARDPQERKKQQLAGESNMQKKSKWLFFQPSKVPGVIQYLGVHTSVRRGGCTEGLASPCSC